MSEMVDDGKRDFLKQASLITAAAGVVGATMAPSGLPGSDSST